MIDIQEKSDTSSIHHKDHENINSTSTHTHTHTGRVRERERECVLSNFTWLTWLESEITEMCFSRVTDDVWRIPHGSVMVRALPGPCGPSSIKRQKLGFAYKTHARPYGPVKSLYTSLIQHPAFCLVWRRGSTEIETRRTNKLLEELHLYWIAKKNEKEEYACSHRCILGRITYMQ